MNIKVIILAAIAVMLVGCDEEASKKVTPKENETKTVVIEKTETPKKEVVVKEEVAKTVTPPKKKENKAVEKPETPKKEVVVKEVKAPSKVKTPVVPSQPEKKVELSSEELKNLFLTAREVQWKVFDGEPYSINQVTEIYSPSFTEHFINRFITERMTPIDINGELKYHVPGSDDGHLILWEGVITFTKGTDVSYYEENGVGFMNISEYQKDNMLEGSHLLTIVFIKVDGQYKINDIKREWD